MKWSWHEQLRRPHAESLFGIVQGGIYADLRRDSAEQLVEMDFDGYAIGGLSVGEPREPTLEVIAEVLPLLPKDKPRYVMGVGYPDEIEQYARMGVDMMDCVLPTRAARHGLLFTSEGRMNIKNKQYAEDQNPPDPACDCMVCRRYSRAYLRHLMQSSEPLAARSTPSIISRTISASCSACARAFASKPLQRSSLDKLRIQRPMRRTQRQHQRHGSAHPQNHSRSQRRDTLQVFGRHQRNADQRPGD